MSGRTLMWLVRSVVFGLATLAFLGLYLFGGRNPIAMVGAIGMAVIFFVYCVVGAKASSNDDNARSRNQFRSKSRP